MTSRARMLVALFVLLFAGGWHLARLRTGEDMTAAAQRFLEGLPDEKRDRASMGFDDAQRLDWHFIPKPSRKGLQIKDMTEEERGRAHVLLKTGLSQLGYDTAVTIIDLEPILRELESQRQGGQIRDPERYYFSVFGRPAAEGRWGWSLEGHHLSLNFVVADGKCVSVTPSFFGANPAEVRTDHKVGAKKGTRPLAKHEDVGFALLHSFNADQLKKALVAEKAPNDVRGAGEPQAPDTAPEGLAAADMTADQIKLLRELITAYTDNMASEVSQQRWSEIEGAGLAKVSFAWMGADKPGIGHYYRIQGPTFVVELCNTQPDSAGNPANHVHTLWRQMDGDFGIPRAASKPSAP